MHPVATLLSQAADGVFPPADGGWHRVAPWRGGVEAVFAFTGHAVLAVADPVPEPVRRRVDGVGGAHHPQVLLDLAGAGWIDSLDAVLARRVPSPSASSPVGLVERPDLDAHPRVAFARSVRDEVRVLGRDDPRSTSVATVARGLGGLPEVSVELDSAERGRGLAAGFLAAATADLPPGALVVAAVAPGNVASVRAFLRAGYQVLGSVQLLRPARS